MDTAAARLGVPMIFVRARPEVVDMVAFSGRVPSADARADVPYQAAATPATNGASAVLAGTLAAAEALNVLVREASGPFAPHDPPPPAAARRTRAAGARDRKPDRKTDMIADADVIRRARMRVAEKITDLIGDTPIVRLHSFERDTPGVELWAKCEFFNPGGSVKDRAAYQMIRDAIRTGAARPGQDDHRLDQRQHRRRLLGDRRRARATR